MRIITYIILSCFIAACSQSRSGGELEQALKLSGENRNALEAVLGHYKHDSLKYRASCFLIKNMPYHYSQEDYYLSPEGEKYRPDICKFKNKEELGMHCDSLTRCRYLEKHDMIYDVLSVDSSFLIKNIDLAFMAWEKPWARDVPFDVFCTYILPYRVQTEKISSLREEMMKRFLPLLDSAGVKTPLEACVALNEHLKSVVRYQDTGLPFYPTIEETYQSGISRCDGICNLGTYITDDFIALVPEKTSRKSMQECFLKNGTEGLPRFTVTNSILCITARFLRQAVIRHSSILLYGVM